MLPPGSSLVRALRPTGRGPLHEQIVFPLFQSPSLPCNRPPRLFNDDGDPGVYVGSRSDRHRHGPLPLKMCFSLGRSTAPPYKLSASQGRSHPPGGGLIHGHTGTFFSLEGLAPLFSLLRSPGVIPFFHAGARWSVPGGPCHEGDPSVGDPPASLAR